eukprot:TRINITY_DN15083_c0_g1_i4.p1 TRINITY_DN15083_c0_g1~~TRINITY_DN15083_c0_g1_i4.p1  ORF type:complete len:465 (+),score=89.66 TRINITY_DN15083_c0_g1_i4:609-2003(+)
MTGLLGGLSPSPAGKNLLSATYGSRSVVDRTQPKPDRAVQKIVPRHEQPAVSAHTQTAEFAHLTPTDDARRRSLVEEAVAQAASLQLLHQAAPPTATHTEPAGAGLAVGYLRILEHEAAGRIQALLRGCAARRVTGRRQALRAQRREQRRHVQETLLGVARGRDARRAVRKRASQMAAVEDVHQGVRGSAAPQNEAVLPVGCEHVDGLGDACRLGCVEAAGRGQAAGASVAEQGIASGAAFVASAEGHGHALEVHQSTKGAAQRREAAAEVLQGAARGHIARIEAASEPGKRAAALHQALECRELDSSAQQDPACEPRDIQASRSISPGTPASQQGVAGFLRSLGLDALVAPFRAHQIAMSDLALLTVHDLKELGMTQIGPRNQLLAAIRRLGPGPSSPGAHSGQGWAGENSPGQHPSTEQLHAEEARLQECLQGIVHGEQQLTELDPEGSTVMHLAAGLGTRR